MLLAKFYKQEQQKNYFASSEIFEQQKVDKSLEVLMSKYIELKQSSIVRRHIETNANCNLNYDQPN